MRLLICGDVVGKSGRLALGKYASYLRTRLQLDFLIVNGENAAHGFGITDKICEIFFELGVDVITTGNHVWDQRQILKYIDIEPRLLRPLNFPKTTPGNGFGVFKLRGKRSILVVNLIGQLFMEKFLDPFLAMENLLENYRLGDNVDVIVVDMHCEATSEKQAMGHFLDGRVSVVVGTHTHAPTADHQILQKGTGFQSDIGMTGPYDSVIGMKKTLALQRFNPKTNVATNPKDYKIRLEPAEGDATLCGVFFEIDDKTGLALRVAPVRMGGLLSETCPK